MHYETSAVINRPIDEVWALLTNPVSAVALERSKTGGFNDAI